MTGEDPTKNCNNCKHEIFTELDHTHPCVNCVEQSNWVERTLETTNVDNLVCPFCGTENVCEKGHYNDDRFIHCEECSKLFGFRVEYSITYTSWKPK